ncbi:low temperature requirement protein A [Nocardia sp. CDC160]|uniref:low temperature requirement protein A n=1 Tax=Nocardia sp. CDC160 TaxID=3112166 RepID=UPI002DBE5780|nr:low temperature requirement protein A [Nocardia sp. CDC160]MEC3919725.1 low temperature requirement protein A [Nocardia sp. CDC160]
MTSDMSGSAAEIEAEGGQVRVSTLELFFDLVFVFTITQLTHVFTHHPGWVELGHVALMFVIIWWMYSGFVYLTNEVAPKSTSRRTFLLVGMFGFFVLAISIPGAFQGSGLAFGLAYFLVNTVHSAMFATSGSAGASSAILRLAPLNLLSALLVMAGGLAEDRMRTLLWVIAVLTQVLSPNLVRTEGFVVRPSHFCERHGLVVIIALGESVVAIGANLSGQDLTVGLVAIVALGLTLGYVLWWAYFGFDDERGEHALAALPEAQRVRPAVLAYGYALIVLLLGIILTAAGLAMTIAHGDQPASTAAALSLSGGVALFLLGQCAFRLALRLPRPWWRLVAAACVLATAPVGIAWVAWGQLVVLIVVAYGFVIADDVISIRTGEDSWYVIPAESPFGRLMARYRDRSGG